MPDQDPKIAQYFNTISSRLPSFSRPTEMGSLQSVQDPNPQSSYEALFKQRFQDITRYRKRIRTSRTQ